MISYTTHTTLFSLGPLNIHSWGLMFALALIAGYILFESEVRRKKDNVSYCEGLMLCIILGALAGSRLFYIFVQDPGYFIANPVAVFKIWEGGLVMYGGLIGAAIAGYVYCRIKKISFWRYADATVPGIAIGLFLTRIGCFINGCCYGLPADLPWAVSAGGVAIHPTQLYESLAGLFLFALSSKLKYRKTFDGWLFLVFVASYAIIRFIIELFRDMPHYIGLTSAQWTGIIALAIAGFIYLKKK